MSEWTSNSRSFLIGGYLLITHYLINADDNLSDATHASLPHFDLLDLSPSVLPFVHAALAPLEVGAGEIEL